MPRSVRRLVLLGLIFLIASAVAWWWPAGRLAAHSASTGFDPMDDVCIVAPVTPFDPGWGIGLHDPRPIPADARCPVCGMFPARFPDWAGQTIFSDGATQFFDSPVNLVVYLRNLSRYSNYRAEDIVISYVNDIPSSEWIPADQAFYVHGSSALGPMREGNLPTFAERSVAERFATERGGVVLTLDEITDPILEALVNDAHQHHAHH